MQKMKSGITTSELTNQRRATGEAVRRGQHEQIQAAKPDISLAGIPGQGDPHHFLTAPFQNIVPVQTAVGNSAVGSLAVNTGRDIWSDYDPGRYEGINAPQGEYNPPITVTYPVDPVTGLVVRHEEIDFSGRTPTPPSKAVVTSQGSARPFSVRVMQNSGVRKD